MYSVRRSILFALATHDVKSLVVAKAAGMSPQTFSHLKERSSNPTLAVMIRLSNAFGISLATFVGYGELYD